MQQKLPMEPKSSPGMPACSQNYPQEPKSSPVKWRSVKLTWSVVALLLFYFVSAQSWPETPQNGVKMSKWWLFFFLNSAVGCWNSHRQDWNGNFLGPIYISCLPQDLSQKWQSSKNRNWNKVLQTQSSHGLLSVHAVINLVNSDDLCYMAKKTSVLNFKSKRLAINSVQIFSKVCSFHL